MSEAVVTTTDHDGIRVITLTDPGSLNGLSPAMRDLFMAAFDEAVHDVAVSAIIVTGAGANFSAGGDVAKMPFQDLDERIRRLEAFQSFVLGWSEQPKPILVAIEGAVAGGGVSLVTASDWAVAATDSRFVAGWLDIGLAPDVGGMWWFVRTLGPKRAYDWLHSSRRMSAQEALESGLVSAVCEPGRALATAIEAATRILRIPAPARAGVKRMLRAALTTPDPRDYRALELSVMTELMHTPEHRQAVLDFLDRRSRARP